MTPKLDEARLRELAEAARASGVALNDAKVFNLTTLSRAHWDACEELDMVIQPVENTILALLNALSAERERGDRAVGLLRELFENGPCDVMIGGNPITVDALQDQINDLLATQKAEGATSTPATTDDSPPPR